MLTQRRQDTARNAKENNAPSKLSQIIVESCIKIHRNLGPGLLESVYQNCLIHELDKHKILYKKEALIPIEYDGQSIQSGFRADLIVNDQIVIEIKSVEKLAPVHTAQTLTYLKLSKLPLALLINFGETYVKDGIHRFANGEDANDL